MNYEHTSVANIFQQQINSEIEVEVGVCW